MQNGIKDRVKGKKKFLNAGCGTNYIDDWINIDSFVGNENVIKHDIREGLPFDSGSLDVIYCSHVIEHLKVEDARYVISEFYRTLSQGGICRIVVPDLNNIITEYLNILSQLEKGSNEELELRYKWILIELFDQSVRNVPGGGMKTFIGNDGQKIKDYIKGRLGHIADDLINSVSGEKEISLKRRISIRKKISQQVRRILLSRQELEYLNTGRFRDSGEVHYWMYDKTGISKTLYEAKFRSVNLMTPFESSIPGWSITNPDVVDNNVLHGSSIYAEAIK